MRKTHGKVSVKTVGNKEDQSQLFAVVEKNKSLSGKSEEKDECKQIPSHSLVVESVDVSDDIKSLEVDSKNENSNVGSQKEVLMVDVLDNEASEATERTTEKCEDSEPQREAETNL